jgi:hypothetical protein
MAVSSKTFAVNVENDSGHMVFGLRAAAADYLRSVFRQKLDSAEDAGINKMTAMQKAAMSYAKAATKSRLCRAVPAALVKWAGYVEYNRNLSWFPEARDVSVGTFDRECISAMPGDVKLVKIGGLTFVGSFEGDLPSDITEVRVAKVGSMYLTTVVHGTQDDGDDDALVPDPVEPEGVDA